MSKIFMVGIEVETQIFMPESFGPIVCPPSTSTVFVFEFVNILKGFLTKRIERKCRH